MLKKIAPVLFLCSAFCAQAMNEKTKQENIIGKKLIHSLALVNGNNDFGFQLNKTLLSDELLHLMAFIKREKNLFHFQFKESLLTNETFSLLFDEKLGLDSPLRIAKLYVVLSSPDAPPLQKIKKKKNYDPYKKCVSVKKVATLQFSLDPTTELSDCMNNFDLNNKALYFCDNIHFEGSIANIDKTLVAMVALGLCKGTTNKKRFTARYYVVTNDYEKISYPMKKTLLEAAKNSKFFKDMEGLKKVLEQSN